VKLNRIHQFLVCLDDFNFFAEDVNMIKENTETVLDLSKDINLEIHVETSKNIFLFPNVD
jgi:hypothetical protein